MRQNFEKEFFCQILLYVNSNFLIFSKRHLVLLAINVNNIFSSPLFVLLSFEILERNEIIMSRSPPLYQFPIFRAVGVNPAAFLVLGGIRNEKNYAIS